MGWDEGEKNADAEIVDGIREGMHVRCELCKAVVWRYNAASVSRGAALRGAAQGVRMRLRVTRVRSSGSQHGSTVDGRRLREAGKVGWIAGYV